MSQLSISSIQSYRMLAFLPTTFIAVFRGRKGAFISWVLTTIGMIGFLFVPHNADLLREGTNAWLFGSIDGLILTMIIGQFFHMSSQLSFVHTRLALAHTELQQKTLDLEVLNGQLQEMVVTDPLTELPNHRAMAMALEQEIERSEKDGFSCSLLFLDIDHFKGLNDKYGHPAGDYALHKFSQIAQMQLRATDIVGRWGGEEFIVILPETSLKEAQHIAERLRIAVSQHTFEIERGLHLSCSIGLASYPEQAATGEGLLSTADQAMYLAKHRGRNQVCTAEELQFTPNLVH
jgi:diguanylate cyclase (GGDEF)-like protein